MCGHQPFLTEKKSMKLIVSLAVIVSFSSSLLAFPSFDPFIDATTANGTSYAVGSPLYHQTNTLGEGWAKWNEGNAASSVFCVNSDLSYANFPAGFPASPANAVFLPGTLAASGGVMGQSAATLRPVQRISEHFHVVGCAP